MALVPIRVDRTSKPPLGTPLRSDGHWSSHGLVGAWAFNEGAGKAIFDSASGVVGSATGGEWSPSGFDVSGASTNYISIPDDPAYDISGKMTVVVGVEMTATVATTQAVICRDDYGKRLLIDNSYGGFKVTSQFGTSLTYPQTTGNRVGLQTNIAYTCGPLGQRIYVGDQIKASDANTNGSFSASIPIRFGQNTNGAYPLRGMITHALLYKTNLDREQVASLSANPWQIYEPETVWIEVGGGGEAALFAGAIYGQSSVSAQLSTAITIASQVVAAGSISGGINTAINLATNAQGSASASALLTTAIRMAASAQGYGGSTADLSTVIALAADILAAGSASGELSTAIRFGGVLSGSATTTAALTNAITMAAQSVGLGSISGQLAGTVAAALFSGTISGSSSASANLSTAVVLAAAAQGSSTAQAAISTALELAAQVNGVGSATGALGADISGLAGSMSGSSESQATLSTAIHLMGLAAGQCGVVGRLAEPVEILAQLRVMTSDPLALTISVRDPLALRVTVQ